MYVRVAQDNSVLFGAFVAKLCKVALERQPWGVSMLQALAHAFRNVSADTQQDNVL